MTKSDTDLSKIIKWLQEQGLTAHVYLSGRIELRHKSTKALVKVI